VSSRIQELDAIVQQFDLNQHPFYTEWRAGTLPIERMADYAAEWAPFIGVLDRGWERVGHPDYAVEEREHDELWTRFRGALKATGTMRRPQSRTLLAVGENASKLAGLREHYAGSVDAGAQRYFEEHAVETDEPAMLASMIDELSEGDFARARTACAIFSAAAWGALDGVYYTD
jgi:pyrroloquinoline quinone (PQQ) biosynthesis protein C